MSTPPYQTVAEPAAAFPPGAVRVKDNGFTQLHDGGLTPSMDIVFIHGLQGHPKKTWLYTGLSRDAEDAAKSRSLFSGITKVFKPSKSPSGSEQRDPISCYWPADILPDQFPTARILTYGYDSHVSHFFSSPTSQNSISANGRSFLNGLAACRIDNETRPILYIVHSLGGLVLKSVTTVPCRAPQFLTGFRLSSARQSKRIKKISQLYTKPHLRSSSSEHLTEEAHTPK